MLELKRPLVVLDLETTGLKPETARIWQIGIIKVYPDGKEKEWEQLIYPGPEPWDFIPTRKVPDLTSSPIFKAVAPAIYTGFKDVDFCGFHLAFDISILKAEFKRVGVNWNAENIKIADAFKLFQMKHARNLAAAVEEYLPLAEQEEYKGGSHTALIDARATLRVLRAQLARWPDLPRTVDDLHTLCFEIPGYLDPDRKLKWINGEACIAFGKNVDKPLKNCDTSFLEWILRNDFSDRVKGIVQSALEGVYPHE